MTSRAPRPALLFVLGQLLLACSAQRAPSEVAVQATASATAAEATATRSSVEDAVFDADFVMAHQSLLTEAQIGAIRNEMSTTQQEILQLEWRLRAGTEQLTAALRTRPVDEARALQLANDVATLESQIKGTHLRLLVRIKNQLTESQEAQLRALRH